MPASAWSVIIGPLMSLAAAGSAAAPHFHGSGLAGPPKAWQPICSWGGVGQESDALTSGSTH